jgi:hypothetical protein
MDFVHLDDMFVMFRLLRPPACRDRGQAEIAQIKIIARECSVAAGVQVEGASV